MLRYCYGLKASDAVKEPGIYFDWKLFTVAGKDDISDLLAQCAINVRKHLQQHWTSQQFPNIVLDVYESIPAHGSHLRKVATNICRTHMTDLMLKKEFKEIMLLSLELQFDIVKILVDEERRRNEFDDCFNDHEACGTLRKGVSISATMLYQWNAIRANCHVVIAVTEPTHGSFHFHLNYWQAPCAAKAQAPEL